MVKRMQTASNVIKARTGVRPVRALTLVAATTVTTAGAAAALVEGALAAGLLAPDGGPAAPQELLSRALVVAALGVLLWLWLALCATALALVPARVGALGRRVADRVAPRLLRRLVTAALGTALVGGAVLAPAVAAPGVALSRSAPVADGPSPAPTTPGPALSVATAPEPGWVPTRPEHRPQPDVAALAPARRNPGPDDRVVVRRGDTLWDLARRHLGPGASAAEVAASWPRWYAVNRDVIGPDPDVIRPGQRLRVPAVPR